MVTWGSLGLTVLIQSMGFFFIVLSSKVPETFGNDIARDSLRKRLATFSHTESHGKVSCGSQFCAILIVRGQLDALHSLTLVFMNEIWVFSIKE